MQENIIKFLQRKHIVSLSVFNQQDMWSTICFYAFNPHNNSLLIRTNQDTRHGLIMQTNPQVTGTIIHDSTTVAKLQGIQFTGQINELHGELKKTGLALYYERFPYARVMKSALWEICFNEIKFTDNTLGFGKKTLWQRQP
ncbi:pyridoxamine 5'-phosphate oxidase family protein [Volucribacter amazonae]|uniref:UPF0306 protein A6A20_06710 n=1 Tax=Volucribacter amazonae TaxID=256731 RepID=A0A9X4SQG9_9PAST|nr:pyridoxamine 5'-phosphate oxidase family protein [Volucribacter amazonae]MDG6895316.1 hypothetical protein [Volucribacter amazonae]